MTLDEALQSLRALADERAVRVWAKMGMDTTKYLGVGLTKIQKLAKLVKRNHILALELWETGIHDAQILATHIVEPKLVSEALLEKWLSEATFFDLSDKLCQNVIAKTSFVRNKVLDWRHHEGEYFKRSAFILLNSSAGSGIFTDEELMDFLTQIEREIQSERNWVKEAMNYALIGIGSVNSNLNHNTLQVTERIGEVHVDYGDTSCKTCDARKSLLSEKVQAKFTA